VELKSRAFEQFVISRRNISFRAYLGEGDLLGLYLPGDGDRPRGEPDLYDYANINILSFKNILIICLCKGGNVEYTIPLFSYFAKYKDKMVA
jgi:hypothetical protein